MGSRFRQPDISPSTAVNLIDSQRYHYYLSRFRVLYLTDSPARPRANLLPRAQRACGCVRAAALIFDNLSEPLARA